MAVSIQGLSEGERQTLAGHFARQPSARLQSTAQGILMRRGELLALKGDPATHSRLPLLPRRGRCKPRLSAALQSGRSLSRQSVAALCRQEARWRPVQGPDDAGGRLSPGRGHCGASHLFRRARCASGSSSATIRSCHVVLGLTVDG